MRSSCRSTARAAWGGLTGSQGALGFLDLPEPLLGVVRSHEGRVLTCLFNLGERPQALTLGTEAHVVGPAHGEVEGQAVNLPAHGYVYLESTGPLTVLPESLGEPGSSQRAGMAS